MAPYYSFGSSLSLQNNGAAIEGVTILNLQNGVVSKSGNVANYDAPVTVLKQGGLTITDPESITLAGTAVLSESATVPNILQSSFAQSGGDGGPIGMGLPANPTAGNLLLVFTWGNGTEQSLAVSGFTLGAKTSQFGNQGCNVVFRVADGSEKNITVQPTGNNNSYVACYIEVAGNYNALFFSGAVTTAGAVVSTGAITGQPDGLLLVAFAEDGSGGSPVVSVSGSGSIVHGDTDNTGRYGVLVQTVAASSSNTVSATFTSAPTATVEYVAASIEPNPASAAATITT